MYLYFFSFFLTCTASVANKGIYSVVNVFSRTVGTRRRCGGKLCVHFEGRSYKTRICAAEMALRYAALCACRKVHT